MFKMSGDAIGKDGDGGYDSELEMLTVHTCVMKLFRRRAGLGGSAGVFFFGFYVHPTGALGFGVLQCSGGI